MDDKQLLEWIFGIIKECPWRKRTDNLRSFFVVLKGGLLMKEQDLKQKLLRFQNPLEVERDQ
jgi:hypothetical protein